MRGGGAARLVACRPRHGKLVLQVDHDGGTSFAPTQNIVFDNFASQAALARKAGIIGGGVIGGGWAGMAAAVELAARDVPVTVFEAAPALGGRDAGPAPFDLYLAALAALAILPPAFGAEAFKAITLAIVLGHHA